MEQDRQRLDKVLWFTRVAKNRGLAVRLVEAGYIRVNGQRVSAPGKPIARGDVLTVALEREVKVMRIVAFAERRGPYKDACRLYELLGEPAGAATPGEARLAQPPLCLPCAR